MFIPKTISFFFFSSLAVIPCLFCSAEPCTQYKFSGNKTFVSCNDLPVLNFALHWTYKPSLNKVDIAVRKTIETSSTWISWAINPTSTGMAGSQSLVAFQSSNGSIIAYTSPISSYKTHLEPGNLSFKVDDLSAELRNKEMIIFATLELDKSTVNHLWQEGPLVDHAPVMHKLGGPNVQSMGTLNFISGESGVRKGGNSIKTAKIVHGVLNAMSWGFLMPIGILIARHGKIFLPGPVWFYTHVTCQCTAVLLGYVGSGIGIWLSKQNEFKLGKHWGFGIGLIVLSVFQVVVARFLRPNKEHRLRVYWNYFHFLVGYGIIGFSIANVFSGIKIAHVGNQWKNGYIGVLVTLGCIALVLEVMSVKRKMNARKSGRQLTGGTKIGAGESSNSFDALTS